VATLVYVTAFLLTDNGDLMSVKTGKTANDRSVVSITPVAVYLNKICEKGCKDIHRVWTVRVTRSLNALKSGYRHFLFLSK
jgi:hypothetical protein